MRGDAHLYDALLLLANMHALKDLAVLAAPNLSDDLVVVLVAAEARARRSGVRSEAMGVSIGTRGHSCWPHPQCTVRDS
jgi:hypothetical protein